MTRREIAEYASSSRLDEIVLDSVDIGGLRSDACGKTNRVVFTSTKNHACLKEATAYAVANFAGKSVVNKSDGRKIMFTAKGIRHGLSGGAGIIDAWVASDLMRFMENAKYIRSMPPKDSRQGNLKASHIYAGKFDIGGHLITVGALVKEYNDGSRYYDHFELKSKSPT